MKIGIKYCGGCNPRFDRTDIAQRLRNDFPDSEIVSAQPDDQLDYVVVVCGCNSACAQIDGLMGKHGRSILTHDEAYSTLLEEIKQMGEAI